MSEERESHWDSVYSEKSEAQLSWHQDDPSMSLELVELAGVTENSSAIDIGGGRSRLAACLIARGLSDVSVLDVSEVALEAARQRLGNSGDRIHWIAADITTWDPDRSYDLWHDRAVFHFLVDADDRAAYLDRLGRGLKAGGHVIIATFASDGPEMCSGLPVVRYSPESLGQTLGDRYEPVAQRFHQHDTPWGSQQSFQYSLFRKTG